MPAPRVFYLYPVKPKPDLMATSKIPNHFKTEKPVAILVDGGFFLKITGLGEEEDRKEAKGRHLIERTVIRYHRP